MELKILAKGFFKVEDKEESVVKEISVDIDLSRPKSIIEQQLLKKIPAQLEEAFDEKGYYRFEIDKHSQYPDTDALSIFGAFKRNSEGVIEGAVMATHIK